MLIKPILKKAILLLTAGAITAGSIMCSCLRNQPVIEPSTTNKTVLNTITTHPDDVKTIKCLKDVQLIEDSNSSYSGTLDCQSIHNLSELIMLELYELHSNSSKIVSDTVSEDTLASIFMCESSYKISPDRGDKFGDSYAGIGQVNIDAITDSLKRIYSVYNSQSEESQNQLSNNYYVQIFNKYVGNINKYYTYTQLKKGAENVFNAIEENIDNASSILGGAISAMTLTAIAGNNWTKLSNNPCLIEMTFYCGIGNMNKYIEAGIIVKAEGKIIFNLNKLYTSGLDNDSIEKFEEGFVYMLKVHSVKNIIKQEGFENYKDEVASVIGTINRNYQYALYNLSEIEVIGGLDRQLN